MGVEGRRQGTDDLYHSLFAGSFPVCTDMRRPNVHRPFLAVSRFRSRAPGKEREDLNENETLSSPRVLLSVDEPTRH